MTTKLLTFDAEAAMLRAQTEFEIEKARLRIAQLELQMQAAELLYQYHTKYQLQDKIPEQQFQINLAKFKLGQL